MLFGESLRQNAVKFPDKTAIVCGDSRLSHSELNSRANRLANALIGMGLRKGDNVAIVADTCLEYIELYFAMAKAGIVIVPVNIALSHDELLHIIGDCGAKVMVFGENYLDFLNTLPADLKAGKEYVVIGKVPGFRSYEELISQYPADEPEADLTEKDALGIWYTSGTTGMPKGVILSHENVVADAANTILSCYPLNRNDVNLCIMPLFHYSSMWLIKCHFYIGSTVVLVGGFDPKLVLETIERERASTTYLTPVTIASLVNSPEVQKYDLSSMRIVLYGGAPLTEAVESRFKQVFGDILMPVYGGTEQGSVLGVPLLDGPLEEVRRRGSVGREVVNVDVRLVNEGGEDCAVGEVGEMLVRGDNMTRGYWNMPEATAKALEGGYLHTGDLARKDEEGYYYIVDRKAFTITSGGKQVYSPEVENVLALYPSVAEVVVVGVPDAELGEAVLAVVVLRDGEKATDKELIQWCAEKLEAYQVPKSVDIVDSLPKSPNGKVLKTALRNRYSKR